MAVPDIKTKEWENFSLRIRRKFTNVTGHVLGNGPYVLGNGPYVLGNGPQV